MQKRPFSCAASGTLSIFERFFLKPERNARFASFFAGYAYHVVVAQTLVKILLLLLFYADI